MAVHLTRIYTRTGDQGDTRLGDMSLVRKDNLRVNAYGEVDELNAVLGVVRLQELPEGWDERLGQVQNDLFDLGADLAVLGIKAIYKAFVPINHAIRVYVSA